VGMRVGLSVGLLVGEGLARHEWEEKGSWHPSVHTKPCAQSQVQAKELP